MESDILYRFTEDDMYRLRRYKGKLVRGKSAADRATLAERIKRLDCDVLAVQEVEDIDTLKTLLHDDLPKRYKHYVLVEGNDPRLIDVALVSKLPIGAVVSWHQLPHPKQPSRPVFGRDLLQVEIRDRKRSRKLLTLFNAHLKSHFGDEDDGGEGKKRNDLKRRREAEVFRDVLRAQTRDGAPHLIVGDMDDPPDSPCPAPFAVERGLVNGLADARETRPVKKDRPTRQVRSAPTASCATAEPSTAVRPDLAEPRLAGAMTGALIDRRAGLPD